MRRQQQLSRPSLDVADKSKETLLQHQTLRNLTRCLALELAEENITVNNIAPGMVLTPFNQQALVNPEVRKKQVQSIPIKRAAQPEEIANAAVFLASEHASYIHGTTLFIDGGLMQNQGQGA